jgi:hypothetical protein
MIFKISLITNYTALLINAKKHTITLNKLINNDKQIWPPWEINGDRRKCR